MPEKHAFSLTQSISVDSLKIYLQDMYSVYLPKKTYPWYYISLEIEPQNVDVNVHPTKNEVRFLHEEAIIKKIKILLNEKLQNEFPQDGFTEKALDKSFPCSEEQVDKKKTKKIFAKDMIRTSTSDQKLEKFNFTVNKNDLKSTEPEKNEKLDIDTMVLLKDKDPLDEASSSSKNPDYTFDTSIKINQNEVSKRMINKENLSELESLKSADEGKAETTFSSTILKLQKEVEDNSDERLHGIISNLIFVGCIDQCSALIQSGANLYICLTEKLVEEVFYQIMLYFANFVAINLSEPISIYELALLGLSDPGAGWSQEEGDKEKLAMAAKNLLLKKADMLKEYFSININKNGNIKSLPVILENYFPSPGYFPIYILRLSTEVDWVNEKACFSDICRETARFYSELGSENDSWKSLTEHTLYSTIKQSLLPPSSFFDDSTIVDVVDLPTLYKVFERC